MSNPFTPEGQKFYRSLLPEDQQWVDRLGDSLANAEKKLKEWEDRFEQGPAWVEASLKEHALKLKELHQFQAYVDRLDQMLEVTPEKELSHIERLKLQLSGLLQAMQELTDNQQQKGQTNEEQPPSESH